ncbi:hypothetical protein [Rhizobium deserti]|nr:hypothetical protein [Rhizobium deserti]
MTWAAVQSAGGPAARGGTLEHHSSALDFDQLEAKHRPIGAFKPPPSIT